MKQNKLIIIVAVFLILIVVLFMAYDFFVENKQSEKNVYEFNLDKFNEVDTTLIEFKEVQQIQPDIEQLRAVATDNNDQIYITGKDKILIYDKDGNLQNSIATGVEALSMTIDQDNDIYLGVRDHIEIWNVNGGQISKWPTISEKTVITSIAVTESSVFVADAGNKIVYHFDLDGNLINEIGRKDESKGIQGFVIPSPYFDLAIGRDGELWVVNSGRHQLESYDKEGNQISSWKKTSMGLDGFSGCCNPSHIAILPNGSYVTSEKGLVRVKIHNPSGEFESVVAAPEQFDKETKGLDLAIDSEERIIVLDPKKGIVRIFQKNK